MTECFLSARVLSATQPSFNFSKEVPGKSTALNYFFEAYTGSDVQRMIVEHLSHPIAESESECQIWIRSRC